MTETYAERDAARLRQQVKDLRAENESLDRELDAVLAIVHDRAPELLVEILAVAA